MLALGIRRDEVIRLELPDGTCVKIRVVNSKIVFDLPDSVQVFRERSTASTRGKPLEGVS